MTDQVATPNPSTSNNQTVASKESVFKESLAIMDDSTWIWNLSQIGLQSTNHPFLRLASTVTIRHSWSRLKEAPVLIIHWEAKGRPGGAIVEEILDIDPKFDIANKIIVLTSNPIHEDVVYFSELGIRRILRIRNREQELNASVNELKQHLAEAFNKTPKPTVESLWRKVLAAIDRLPEKPEEELLARIEENMGKLKNAGKVNARDFDAMASMSFIRGDVSNAFKQWEVAIQNNPNYFRTYNNMIAAHRKLGQHQEAYQLLQKMQMLNRSNISRLVAMGESQLALNDDLKAEHYFQSALEKDGWCSGALNGMADIRFRQGDLDGARTLLEKSNVSYKYATRLNLMGIDMVKKEAYAEALEHYSKAQYVLPQQEKGPQLFFNIGLCYSRWSKPNMAKEFLKLALVKEPNYKKAQRLLDLLEGNAAPEINEQVTITKNAS